MSCALRAASSALQTAASAASTALSTASGAAASAYSTATSVASKVSGVASSAFSAIKRQATPGRVIFVMDIGFAGLSTVNLVYTGVTGILFKTARKTAEVVSDTGLHWADLKWRETTDRKWLIVKGIFHGVRLGVAFSDAMDNDPNVSAISEMSERVGSSINIDWYDTGVHTVCMVKHAVWIYNQDQAAAKEAEAKAS